MNVTRHPIYNHVEGPSTWRFDMAMRPLDGTGFEGEFGRTSSSCLPHGIIGQAYDGDSLGIGGKVDNYTPVNPNIPVITTSAQAEGAIEGSHSDYKLTSAVSTDFKYTRFGRAFDDKCAARDVAKLRGTRVAYASSGKTEQVRTPRLYILSRKQKCSYTITRLGLNAFVYEMIRKLQCIERLAWVRTTRCGILNLITVVAWRSTHAQYSTGVNASAQSHSSYTQAVASTTE